MDHSQLDTLNRAFADQLSACLEECAGGRRGLFSDRALEAGEPGSSAWPEADRLRTLAFALDGLFRQEGERNALLEEFLDLCTIHGERDPGEQRLARLFLTRIERGEVGSPTQTGNKPW